ncbi:MAG: DUF4159 domain-containing protein, partial [Planctomycetes bacterium]|nr:DUF4159 domain-containing protein [Planctomycetota bacterium]
LLAAAEVNPVQRKILERDGWNAALDGFAGLLLMLELVLAVASLAAFARRRWALAVVRAALLALGVVLLASAWPLFGVPGHLHAADTKHFDKAIRNELWLEGGWLWAIAVMLAAGAAVAVYRRACLAFYRREDVADEQPGDRLVRELRTGGREPVFRTSMYWAITVHVIVLFVFPIVMKGCVGAQAAYGLPQGSGTPVLETIAVKKKKPKKTKSFVFNMNSAIIYARPDIDDMKVMESVDEDTTNTYTANTSAIASGLGAGGKGKGGWPNGMADSRVRFIRLQYDGRAWDEGMGHGSDYNMLIKFKDLTGFKIAEDTEAKPVLALKKFPPGKAPPFVYMTGEGGISLGGDELRVLKWYLTEEAGMIFADNAGGDFANSLKALMRRVLPDVDWVEIANDDPIFLEPYSFPNGAPKLWAHSGGRALGLKVNGRWAVFFHQGELKDAWKDGHSGVNPGEAKQAYKLGVNVMYYAFTHYSAAHATN